MKHFAVAALSCALALPALAGFSGQTILGPLSNGSVVTGNTSFSLDSNDGFTSGDHIFNIWDGKDDVWQLNWTGGDLAVNLLYDNSGSTDLDLFVYRPGSYDDSGDYSILNTGTELVEIPGADAGTYYIVIDSTAGAEGAYTLSIVPAPGTGALLVLAGAGLARRRRR